MFASRTFYDPKRKIWHGSNVPPLYHPDAPLGQLILNMLSREPEKIVQISDSTGVKITANEMKTMSIRAAQNIQRMGIKQEDVIGVIASNSPYLAPLVFGAFLCGSSISTLDPSFDKGEIKHMFSITKPKIIFCDAEISKSVKEAIEEIKLNSPIFTLKGRFNGLKSAEDFLKETGDEDNFIVPKLIKGGKQVAAILCSSGTTGLPKGVRMTHNLLVDKTQSTVLTSDILLCFSSLYWLSGLSMLLIGTIHGCTRIITDEPFTPELMLRLIDEYKVTTLFSPPSQMALMINSPDIKIRNLASLKSYLCGGSALPICVLDEMQRYIPNGTIISGYGMSEIAGVCTVESSKMNRKGSVGQVSPNSEIKIIDDNNQQLGIGEKGEILIKSGYDGLGYYGNEEATKSVFDSDGWVHSGDIGYFDEDGYLFIIDRKKEILKYKNFHFYPTEIEGVIMQIPDVVEVCVCGVPDIVFTDLPGAAVVKRKNSTLSEDAICKYVAENMSHFKHLRGGVIFVDKLPKTASGKIKRRDVKGLLENVHKSKKV